MASACQVMRERLLRYVSFVVVVCSEEWMLLVNFFSFDGGPLGLCTRRF